MVQSVEITMVSSDGSDFTVYSHHSPITDAVSWNSA